MKGHAESHNELASLLDIHLARPVSPFDTMENHTELHNQLRERILALTGPDPEQYPPYDD